MRPKTGKRNWVHRHIFFRFYSQLFVPFSSTFKNKQSDNINIGDKMSILEYINFRP